MNNKTKCVRKSLKIKINKKINKKLFSKKILNKKKTLNRRVLNNKVLHKNTLKYKKKIGGNIINQDDI